MSVDNAPFFTYRGCMRRLGGLLRVLGILVIELAAVLGLHWLGGKPAFQIDWHDLHNWLTTSTLQDLISASMRLFALVLAYYFLITTVLYTALALLRVRSGLRLMRFVTFPVLRVSLDRALAVTILTAGIVGASGGLAMADTSATIPFPGAPTPVTQPTSPSTTSTTQGSSPNLGQILKGIPLPGGPSTKTSSTTATTTSSNSDVIPGLGNNTTTTQSSANPSVPAAPTNPVPTKVEGEQTYKVVTGDNLWTISKAHLAEVRGVDESTLTDRDVAQYWLTVIDVNKPTLRSGDPDLIYPGEAITLPSP